LTLSSPRLARDLDGIQMHIQPLLARKTPIATVALHQNIPSIAFIDSPAYLAADAVTTQPQTPMLVQAMDQSPVFPTEHPLTDLAFPSSKPCISDGCDHHPINILHDHAIAFRDLNQVYFCSYTRRKLVYVSFRLKCLTCTGRTRGQ
jgi:hypothetical protein